MKYLKNIEPYKASNLKDFVAHTGRKIASKAIIDNEHTEIRFFSFAEGEDIDKEYYEKETIFMVLEGSLKVPRESTRQLWKLPGFTGTLFSVIVKS